MRLVEQEGLTFDDVLIQPRYSDINTRSRCDTSVDFMGINLDIPIISSNMDLVTGGVMANAMWEAGGMGILHRFYKDDDDLLDDLEMQVIGQDYYAQPLAFSVGVRDIFRSMEQISLVRLNFSNRTLIVTIDVAHGHHEQVKDLIKLIKDDFSEIKIIAGNVATANGASFLQDAGADAIKVGIGPGAACTTRVVTGVGVPQLTAISAAADNPYISIPIIADGGIRSSGDIVKALAAGADVVMLGSLLAGAKECPGEVIVGTDGRRYRRYIGQSVYGVNGYKYTKEGVSGFVEEKGAVADILKQLVGGIKSGMSYVGASDLEELRQKTWFIKVSSHTQAENQPRIREFI